MGKLQLYCILFNLTVLIHSFSAYARSMYFYWCRPMYSIGIYTSFWLFNLREINSWEELFDNWHRSNFCAFSAAHWLVSRGSQRLQPQDETCFKPPPPSGHNWPHSTSTPPLDKGTAATHPLLRIISGTALNKAASEYPLSQAMNKWSHHTFIHTHTHTHACVSSKRKA